jgi:hypothetical protein
MDGQSNREIPGHFTTLITVHMQALVLYHPDRCSREPSNGNANSGINLGSSKIHKEAISVLSCMHKQRGESSCMYIYVVNRKGEPEHRHMDDRKEERGSMHKI